VWEVIFELENATFSFLQLYCLEEKCLIWLLLVYLFLVWRWPLVCDFPIGWELGLRVYAWSIDEQEPQGEVKAVHQFFFSLKSAVTSVMYIF